MGGEDALDLGGDFCVEILSTWSGFASPLLEVGVASEQPGVHRRPVDRRLEAGGEFRAGLDAA